MNSNPKLNFFNMSEEKSRDIKVQFKFFYFSCGLTCKEINVQNIISQFPTLLILNQRVLIWHLEQLQPGLPSRKRGVVPSQSLLSPIFFNKFKELIEHIRLLQHQPHSPQDLEPQKIPSHQRSYPSKIVFSDSSIQSCQRPSNIWRRRKKNL